MVRADYYKSEANKQYVAPAGNNFDRGNIYFTKKDGQLISAAVIKNGFQAVINPKIIKDPENIYERLSKIVSLDKDDFLKRSQKDDSYEVIAHRLDSDTAAKIKDLNIKGLSIFSESWRSYPADSLASKILGFVGYKGNELTGRYGLEQYYESVLARDDKNNSINSFAEILTDIKGVISGDTSKKGDIVLTIEPNVQLALENNLEKALKKYEAKTAAGIIIEPKTGKILAMAAKPDFNPNSYGENKDLAVFTNPNVESVFEMGSIMKSLTVAAAVDQGKITVDTRYNDAGYVDVEGTRLNNFDKKARGNVSIQDVLNNSINTGAVFVMRQLGKEKFRDYLINYGFGEKTNIDLPAEVPGMISNVTKSPREIEYATASFGQGFAVTPIEMASAFSSLANGGFLMKPYIVEEIKLQGAKDKEIGPEIRRTVLKKETTEEVSRMLTTVFDKALLNGIYKMDHYSVAAKTGTAQSVVEGQKGYQEGEYVHTFFGYTPAFDAKFLTLLILVKPKNVQYAAYSLSEPFVNITKFLLNYYEVPPDR
ncbi:MAG: penicillin-binding protein 2 [Candidatus Parcubacteria bacterium]|nr:penicillin-binding protein 2 [Candidatus Parcubacteria bacterium]